jgi:hypothetical protein
MRECAICGIGISEEQEMCIVCESEMNDIEVDLDLDLKSKRAFLRDLEDEFGQR